VAIVDLLAHRHGEDQPQPADEVFLVVAIEDNSPLDIEGNTKD